VNKDETISVGIVSLGCAKNQVDAEIMAGALTEAGYVITPVPEQAQIIIVNTCGFIDEAKQEAIDTILEMAEYKKAGSCRALIVTGCLAQRYFTEIQESLPEVDGIVGVGGFQDICEAVEKVCSEGGYLNHRDNPDLEYLNGSRILFTPKGSAYLKIAEGCDNRCHYCAIPGIRGPFRSRPMEELVQEAERLADEGVRELVLIAQDTTRYGKDLYGEPRLTELIHRLDQIDGVQWIRIMYLYPDEITESLIETIKNCSKVVPYVDLPIQHISTELLKRMNRRGSGEDIRHIFQAFRDNIPGVVIRTSLIVGYPGETQEDFNELKEFVKETRFDRMGIFKYSMEENTVAAKMEPQVEEAVKEERYKALMELQQEISRANNELRVGRVYQTLVEGVSDDGIFYIGRTYAEGPEVDGNVYFTSPEPLEPGDMADVKILIAEDYDLTGEAIIGEKGLED
jgi:ribosomal protein S12 methylthiotransferase